MNLDENLFYKKILMRIRKELPAGSGAAGPKGDTGAAGAAGATGATGAVGSQGPQGDRGVAGPSGAAGSTGGVGAAGVQGPIGLTGLTGPIGNTGAQGPIGLTGAAGAQGVQGDVGPAGAKGNTGAAGLDAKRIDTYTGTTDANGLLTITYTSAFAAVPSIQPEPPTASNQVWIKVTSTTTGCSLRLVQRAAVTVLGLEVLLAGVTNVAGAPARVVVVAA